MPIPTHIVIDIETAPRTDAWVVEELKSSVNPPGNYGPAATSKWWSEKGSERIKSALGKGALSGTTGQITAIGWRWWPGETTDVVPRAGPDTDDERAMLERFMTEARDTFRAAGRSARPLWTGYNITGFDLRYLWQRCIALDVAMGIDIPYNARPWAPEVFDLMRIWCGGDRQSWQRKELVAQALGIPIPEDARHGAEMPALFAAGDYHAIAQHCRQDVDMEVLMLERIWSNPA